MTERQNEPSAPIQPGNAAGWIERFIADLAIVRPENTVRAYRHDLKRWLSFCNKSGLDPLAARSSHIIAFIRSERERVIHEDATVSARTIVRRLAAIRQWYNFLSLEPELTGVHRNPVPGGASLRAAAGVITGQPALLHYDRLHPETLTADEVDRFIAQLTASSHRDRAIVFLLKDGAVRISEALDLRLGDIHWAGHRVTVRSTKSHNSRIVPLSEDALNALGNYIRLERPQRLDHDYVFVCLGRRNFGQPFSYRGWVYVCEQARQKAGTPRVHAHAFRHTCATNLAEAGMPLDALQRQLGHRRIETTLIYNEIRDGRLQREYLQAMAACKTERVSSTGATKRRNDEPDGKCE
ncbi:MAG: tyrosine-type recombinase/integrase [Blastocatellales bacterium]